jgi:general secretion pathway protein D
LAAAAVLSLAACATDSVLTESRRLIERGEGEQGLELLTKAMQEAPREHAYRTEYFRSRELLVAQWLAQAETLRLAEQYDPAEELYRRVRRHDPENARARLGAEAIEREKRHRALITRAGQLLRTEKYHEAYETLRTVLAENPRQREARRLQRAIEEKTERPALAAPVLKPLSAKPVSLELREVALRAVFDVLARISGINFVFDKDLRADQKTSLVVRDTTVEELLRLVNTANQLSHKVLNENTVLVYPNTPQKQRDYQELVVKAFYLANADVRQTANMVRAVVKTRDLFIDEKLNLLVLRDTPSSIRLAERLIAAQDLAEPEVMLEVEVLEVGYNRLLELGLRFPDSVAWSLVGAAGTAGTVTLPEWLGRGSELVRLSFTNPLFLLTLRQQDGTTSVLANPRIRVKNKERARIHIGDRVPVITTTAAAAGGFVSESVSYLDVGLKLEVEPLVYLEDDVGIKVGLEVSNIAREVRGATTNTLTYQIGTRNAATNLRLRDGETQILAGLISDEDRRSASRVPGLGELPVLGRLFSSTRDSSGRTEIVLLITPRIMRALARPEVRDMEFAAGTDAAAGATGPFAAPALPAPPPAAVPAPPPAAPPPSPAAPPMVPFGGVAPPERPR